MRGKRGKSETIHAVYLLWLPKIVMLLYSILFLCQIFPTIISPSLFTPTSQKIDFPIAKLSWLLRQREGTVSNSGILKSRMA